MPKAKDTSVCKVFVCGGVQAKEGIEVVYNSLENHRPSTDHLLSEKYSIKVVSEEENLENQ